MKNIKEKLLKLEEDFNLLKNRLEKYHLIFIIIYFLPPVLAIFLLSKFFQDFLNLAVKIIIFSIIISGLAIHFFLRYKLYKSKDRYKKFIQQRLEKIADDFPDEENFNQTVVETARNIFANRGISFSNVTINDSTFWNLIFINLGIENFTTLKIDDDKLNRK
ncbi:MAG: hypothetical protein KAT05_13030 [Spirochaetes bacterium]|nr:hypothetical protein [Spirochaetota bacterium]